MDYNTINDSMKKEITEIKAYIESYLESDIELIEKVSKYIIDAPSKKIRPILVAIIGKAFNLEKEKSYKLAVIIEFIHTATLLHDDVVDLSGKRRGKETVNKIWGNEASVLVGDFLYSRSFEIMVELKDMEIMKILSHATNTIAKGEVLQLMCVDQVETNIDQYLRVIQYKTATLFEALCECTAILAGCDNNVRKNLSMYGRNIGLAFQISDDVLDYTADSNEQIGKNIGDDLSGGKITLPFIYAYQNCTETQREVLKDIIQNRKVEDFMVLRDIIIKTNSIKFTQDKAKEFVRAAKKNLEVVENSEISSLLNFLAEFSINRKK
ncbi:polyprenyl synthetase family protein [Gammaproteobacteria bacterium]|nr:polyprenyl synthetase family protein [Gammaproteobacteria bacterium]